MRGKLPHPRDAEQTQQAHQQGGVLGQRCELSALLERADRPQPTDALIPKA